MHGSLHLSPARRYTRVIPPTHAAAAAHAHAPRPRHPPNSPNTKGPSTSSPQPDDRVIWWQARPQQSAPPRQGLLSKDGQTGRFINGATSRGRFASHMHAGRANLDAACAAGCPAVSQQNPPLLPPSAIHHPPSTINPSHPICQRRSSALPARRAPAAPPPSAPSSTSPRWAHHARRAAPHLSPAGAASLHACLGRGHITVLVVFGAGQVSVMHAHTHTQSLTRALPHPLKNTVPRRWSRSSATSFWRRSWRCTRWGRGWARRRCGVAGQVLGQAFGWGVRRVELGGGLGCLGVKSSDPRRSQPSQYYAPTFTIIQPRQQPNATLPQGVDASNAMALELALVPSAVLAVAPNSEWWRLGSCLLLHTWVGWRSWAAAGGMTRALRKSGS
jgi:hypothetical protein